MEVNQKEAVSMVTKRILCPERLRRVPKQFSWVDHRLVRDKRICGLSHASLALYLFLVTVSDADGLSYYSDATVGRLLSMDAATLEQGRHALCRAGLVAYCRPFYQVLSLEKSAFSLKSAPCEYSRSFRGHAYRQAGGETISIRHVLGQVLGGVA